MKTAVLLIMSLIFNNAAHAQSCQGVFQSTFSSERFEPKTSFLFRDLRRKAAVLDQPRRAQIRPSAIDIEAYRQDTNFIWTDPTLDPNEKIERALTIYLQHRMRNLDPYRRELAQSALASIRPGKIKDNAQYSHTTGQIEIGDYFAAVPLFKASVLVHEFEHLTQFGQKKMNDPTHEKLIEKMITDGLLLSHTSVFQETYEGEAIGAQWDFLQVFPSSIVDQAIAQVKAHRKISRSDKQLMQLDIESAILSRDEYVRVNLLAASYTTYYKMKEIRTNLMILGGGAAGTLLFSALCDQECKEFLHLR